MKRTKKANISYKGPKAAVEAPGQAMPFIPQVEKTMNEVQEAAMKNGLGEACGIPGATWGPNNQSWMQGATGMNGFNFPGGATNPISDTSTLFSNLRWFLVSNYRQLLSQMFVEIGLVQTICMIPVQDALRGGVEFKSQQIDEEQIKQLRLSMDRDGDITTAAQAAIWNRLFGGAGIMILVDDQDPEDELEIESINEETDLEFRAVDMWELFSTQKNVDVYEATIQQHEFEQYDYYGEKIDKSRVLPLKGIEAPSFVRPRLRGWGLSVGEALVRSINQYLKSTDLGFEVLDEFKVDVYKIKNLVNTLLTPGGSNSVKARIQMANWQKSYQNAVVMDSEDDWDHKQLSFTGLAEAMEGIRQQVSADMRIPQIKLFGQSFSSGMGNSAQDEMENYNNMVEAEVRGKLKFHILRMAEIKCQKLFGFIPDDLEAEFKPLRELTAEQQENVKTQKFNRALQAKSAGEISQKDFLDICNKGNLFDVQIDTTGASVELEDVTDDAENPDDEETIPAAKPKPKKES